MPDPPTPPTGLRALRQLAYGGLLHSLEGICRALRYIPWWAPERHGIRVEAGIPYRPGGGPDQRLDLYRPSGSSAGPLPVAIYVHGGGFRYFSRQTHWAMASAFAREGFLTFNVGYRKVGSAPYPAAVEDVAAAFAWIAEHAEELGGDLDRMVWAGESAGANLVLGMTIATCWPRPEPHAAGLFGKMPPPRVLLPACGYLEVSRPERHAAARPLPQWIADRIEGVTAAYLPDHRRPSPAHDLANPLCLLESPPGPPERPLPATYAIVGSKDPVLDDSVRVAAAVSALGSPGSMQVYQGGIHAFHALRFKALAQRAWADQFAFVRDHLGAGSARRS